jgi:hypothetical protein
MKKIVSVIILIISIQNVIGQSKTWSDANVGASKDVLYLPDGNAVYWRYGWQRKTTDTDGIVITGQFPDARYFSYNVYNDVSKSSVGSIADVDIKPDYQDSYTIYIVPEGTVINKKNVLYFDKTLQNVSVILRHYLAKDNIFGNKSLPTIAYYDTEKKILKPAPETLSIPSNSNNSELSEEEICKELVAKTFYFNKKDSLQHSFNLNSGGTYPNNDNHYLTMPMIKSNKDDVCIVKFKAPSYPKSKKGYAKSDVRYFSLGQGDEITHNLYTIADFQFITNPDGFIYLLIADGSNDALINKAKSLKMNFMPWLVNEKMLLVYRNMLPNPKFKYGTNSVKKIDKAKPLTNQYGDKFIGNYAPIGFFLNKDVLLNSEAIPKF